MRAVLLLTGSPRGGPRQEVRFVLDSSPVALVDDGCSLLEALRDRLGVRSAKDGCSPQGQCGCCTVWVDGQPRVACVTPLSRVHGREVTTLAGLDHARVTRWADALCASGGSQCGFCTPGIVMRLEALRTVGSAPSGATQLSPRSDGPPAPAAIGQALLAHLCRCTGWQTIREAAAEALGAARPIHPQRDLLAAQQRAQLEGRTPQRVAPDVALGRGGFADDTAPPDALVAVRSAAGEWVVGETLTEARRAAGKVQGRRTSVPLRWPLTVPDGDWQRVLSTTWVEPAYLEPDAAWCAPGGTPVGPLANGGAFGGKASSSLGRVARHLADRHGRPVRVLLSREDVTNLGPKRPPVAVGVRADGTGLMRIARTPGVAAAVHAVAPGLVVEELDVPGPRTSCELRGSGWVEAAVVLSALCDVDHVLSPDGALASAVVTADGAVEVSVRCGRVLDEVVLRSYCVGAAHMALGWVRSEGLAVDEAGVVHDLTIRSYGVLRAVDTPPISVEIVHDEGPPVNGSEAVFAAVAAAAWRAAGHPPRWPLQRAVQDTMP